LRAQIRREPERPINSVRFASESVVNHLSMFAGIDARGVGNSRRAQARGSWDARKTAAGLPKKGRTSSTQDGIAVTIPGGHHER